MSNIGWFQHTGFGNCTDGSNVSFACFSKPNIRKCYLHQSDSSELLNATFLKRSPSWTVPLGMLGIIVMCPGMGPNIVHKRQQGAVAASGRSSKGYTVFLLNRTGGLFLIFCRCRPRMIGPQNSSCEIHMLTAPNKCSITHPSQVKRHRL
jgi:hypothetical protein